METKTKIIIGVAGIVITLIVIAVIARGCAQEGEQPQSSSSANPASSSITTAATSQTTASSSSDVKINPNQITNSIAGIDEIDGMDASEAESIGLALSDYIGESFNPETAELSITTFSQDNEMHTIGTPDASMILHDATSGLDYSMYRLDGKWKVSRSSELPAEASSSSSSIEEPAEEHPEDIASQNQWASIFNFNNAIFDIDDAALLGMALDDGLISNNEAEAIESGVAQFLNEEGIIHPEVTSIFLEKKSIATDEAGRPTYKLMVNHSGGSTVLSGVYDPDKDGIYLDLYSEDETTDTEQADE